MKKLMTGNEAIARGAYEAGVRFASAYPGTPSTEILENLSTYDEIYAEWAPNEKVAMEAAIGASMGGARSMASMKHVGVNVAADPMFTFAYTGVNGGMVFVSADEPGQHSSQNEQDNRNYASFAKIPMLEPADSQECKDFLKLGFEISEQFDTPVMLRPTTRVCHSKTIVDCVDRVDVPIKPYVKNVQKYITVPAIAKKLRIKVEERMHKLAAYSEETPLNRVEYNDKAIGVIASGMCYYYAKEVYGDSVSYLKLGFTWPLPMQKIKSFCESVGKVIVVEENDPIIETAVKTLGFQPIGKDVIPPYDELMPNVLRQVLLDQALPLIDYARDKVVPRPPILCAGCPHRGFFYELGKRKNVAVAGDIGCYTLAFAPPYNAMDCNICMGASFSSGHGMQKVFNMIPGNEQRVVAVLGDSTFFHTGVNSLLEVVYNNSNTVCVVLDNRITGMTGHQENPGTGFNAKGEVASKANVEDVVRACGIQDVYVVNPNHLSEVKDALDKALASDAPSVIITRWPCVLKRMSAEEKQSFDNPFTTKCAVNVDTCVGCKLCIKSGCPAISFNKAIKKSTIDDAQCVGCGVCAQICPKQAIETK